MYLVINIGCLECGVSSKVVGVFRDESLAERVAEQCNEKYRWRENGLNEFAVFALPEAERIDEEYDILAADDVNVNPLQGGLG